MTISRLYEIVCDVCEEPIAAATYLTEARQQVRRAGGQSVAGMRPMQSVKDVCGDCREEQAARRAEARRKLTQ